MHREARAHPRACIVTNDMYRDYAESEERRGRSRREAVQWCKSHLISFVFLGDEFVYNPEFEFPAS